MSESQRILLHPLVVMNIADHLTRAKYRQQPGAKGYRVIGCILGRQDGRVLEIMNTVETKFEARDPSDATVSSIQIDEEYTQRRVAAYKVMFPDLDCVGWYSVKGTTTPDEAYDQPTADDLATMKDSMSKICDNPIFLVMNPKSQSALDKKKLPFFMYQKGPVGSDGQTTAPYVALDFKPASEESEQIAVDGVSNAVDPNAKHSALAQRMAAPINAVKILRTKLNFLIMAVKNSTEVRQNKNFMRRLNQIVSSTPISTQEAYDAQFFGEYSDSAALNMLTSVTQSCQSIQQLIDDYHVLETQKPSSSMMDDGMSMGGMGMGGGMHYGGGGMMSRLLGRQRRNR